jgi:nucleoside-diphosphate-sugar epimerase
VGSHVAVELRRRGASILPLFRRPVVGVTFEGWDFSYSVQADLTDESKLRSACEQAEVVLHVAGLTKGRNEREYMEVNAEGTRRLARAAASANPRPSRFVLVSSLAAAGPSGDRPRVESDPCAPVSAYGRSKLAGERAAVEELAKANIPWTIIRPPIVYGERDRDVLLVFRQIRAGLIPIVGGRASLTKRYSLVHAEDLARGIVDATDSRSAENQVYFLPGPRDATFEEMVAGIERAVGKTARRIPVPRAAAVPVALGAELLSWIASKPSIVSRDKLRELDAPGWTCSGAAAARDFNYRPSIDFPEGFEREAGWARARGLL